MSDLYEQDPLLVEQTIEEWVVTKCEDWRDYYESNMKRVLKSITDFGEEYGILLIASVSLSVVVSSLLHFSRPLSLM